MTAEDIVKRLRHRRNESWAAVMEQAAYIIEQHLDEVKHWEESYRALTAIIERQNKALEEAEKALEPFAADADRYDPDEGDGHFPIWGEQKLLISDIRRARSAIATIRAARGEKE